MDPGRGALIGRPGTKRGQHGGLVRRLLGVERRPALHYRDYAGDAERPPILCIPGLTRNARDFEGVAERLAGNWRLICVELRGRGESAYAKDPMTYVPLDLSPGHGGADRRS